MTLAKQPRGMSRSRTDVFANHRTKLHHRRACEVEVVVKHLEAARKAGGTERKSLPFQEASACHACRQSFTLKRRRHHCRLCSKSVCAACHGWRSLEHPYDPKVNAEGHSQKGKWGDEVKVCRACEAFLDVQGRNEAFHASVVRALHHPQVTFAFELEQSRRNLMSVLAAAKTLATAELDLDFVKQFGHFSPPVSADVPPPRGHMSDQSTGSSAGAEDSASGDGGQPSVAPLPPFATFAQVCWWRLCWLARVWLASPLLLLMLLLLLLLLLLLCALCCMCAVRVLRLSHRAGDAETGVREPRQAVRVRERVACQLACAGVVVSVSVSVCVGGPWHW